MTTTVKGVLRHHFHGNEHVAAVSLRVGSLNGERQLTAALEPLGLPFKLGSTMGRANVFGAAVGPLTSEQVDKLKEWLEPRRTDPPCTLFDCHPKHRRFGRTYGRHEIDGCEHSIDYGPEFELELPYVDLATPELPFDPIIHVRVGD